MTRLPKRIDWPRFEHAIAGASCSGYSLHFGVRRFGVQRGSGSC